MKDFLIGISIRSSSSLSLSLSFQTVNRSFAHLLASYTETRTIKVNEALKRSRLFTSKSQLSTKYANYVN